MRGERQIGVWILVGMALFLGARGVRAGKGSDVEARLTHLEVEFRKLQDTVREDGVKLTSVGQRQDSLDERLALVLPGSARWMTLSPGGTLRWEPRVGGQVYLQFVRLTGDGRAPVVHLKVDPGSETEAPVMVGETLEVVDDRGAEKRIFKLTLHRMVRGESTAQMALFSLESEKVSE